MSLRAWRVELKQSGLVGKLTKRRYFLNNAFWVIVQDVSTKILGMLLVIGLTRIYSKELFGEYSFVLGVVGLITVFNLAGISNAIVQSVARGFEATFRRATYWTVISSLIGSVILIIYGIYQMEVRQNADLFWVFVFASVLFPAAYGLEQWSQYYEGKQEFKRIALLQILKWSVTYSAVVGVAWLWPSTVVYSLLVVFLLRSTFNLLYTRDIFAAIQPAGASEAGAIPYGLHTSLYAGVNRVANHLDKVLLYEFVSPEALAVYFVADRIAELTKASYQNISSIFVPRYARTKGFRRAAEKRVEIVAGVMMLAILAFAFLVIPWLLPIVFAAEYQTSVVYCQVLLCSLCIGVSSTLKYAFIRSKLDARGFRNVNLIPNGARIALIVVLVPLFGVNGALAAAVGYRIVLLFVTNASLAQYKEPARGD